MQSHERIVGSAKKISLDGQSFVINQVPPLNHRSSQKRGPEKKRQKPPPRKCPGLCFAQGTHGEMNRYAARKQANGEKDRHAEYLLWRRSAEALADIKEVGDNKDAENGRLSGNEAVHCYTPTRRGSPSEFRFECCDCGYAHQNLPLLILPIRIFRVLQVPKWTTALYRRNHGKVISRRWRTGGPLQGPVIPGIVSGDLASEIRPDQVGGENQYACGLKYDADAHDQVQGVPTPAGFIGVNSPRHA